MRDAAPDNHASEAHLPWESIGAAEEQGERADPAEPFDEQLQPARAAAAAVEPILPQVSRETDEQIATNEPAAAVRGGGWTLPLLCGGIALVACGVLIPQADANRRLAYDRQMLKADLDSVDRQIAVNGEFLKKVASDPTLAERLAERQMKFIPEGTRVLELQHETDGSGMSPFQLVSVSPPPPPPPYKPVGGTIANLCYDPHSRLYLIGAALGMIAIGLVLGYAQDGPA